jgi:hypothetical protein
MRKRTTFKNIGSRNNDLICCNNAPGGIVDARGVAKRNAYRKFWNPFGNEARLLDLTNIGFDKYSDNVREADASFILSGPDVATWGVAQCALNRIVLQFGNAGGATIAFGITRPDAALLVTQRTSLQEGAIFNGQLAGPNDIAILPPASHYTFANGPNHWLSISVPLDIQDNLSVHLKDALFPKRPTLVRPRARRSTTIDRSRATQTSASEGASVRKFRRSHP